jgi:hypothetical protein
MDPAIWLDKVRAVPIIGLKFEPVYRSASSCLDALTPLMTKWQAQHHWTPTLKLESPTSLTIETDEGFGFQISHDSVVSKFVYSGKLIEKGFQQPSIEFATALQPVSKLFKSLEAYHFELISTLLRGSHRELNRIGILVSGTLEMDALPPGFEAFLAHLQRPWKHGVQHGDLTLLSVLGKSDIAEDKCHHGIKFAQPDAVNNLSFKLDWQRYYSKPVNASEARMVELYGQCFADAQRYFGTFGLGELNYVNG